MNSIGFKGNLFVYLEYLLTIEGIHSSQLLLQITLQLQIGQD